MPKVIGVSISAKKGVPKENIPEGEFIVGVGLAGDAHGGDHIRQVSLLAQESIDRMAALGTPGLHSGAFAENITTQGIVLHELPIGTQLEIGGARFEVTKIGKECHQKCAIFRAVGNCIMPSEGIFAKVIKSGIVRPGDAILLAAVNKAN